MGARDKRARCCSCRIAYDSCRTEVDEVARVAADFGNTFLGEY